MKVDINLLKGRDVIGCVWGRAEGTVLLDFLVGVVKDFPKEVEMCESVIASREFILEALLRNQ